MNESRTEQIASEALPAQEQEIKELTLDEALEVAVKLQQSHQFEAAAQIYNVLVRERPDFAGALHFSGVLLHQIGQPSEALARIERSLELVPDVAAWHNNYGLVLQETGRLDDAIAEYRKAIALDPEHANAYNNMGVLLRAQGRTGGGRTGVPRSRAAGSGQPGQLVEPWRAAERDEAHRGRGRLFLPRDHVASAQSQARRLLALAHCTLGEIDEAVRIFEEWLGEEPDNPIALHMLAACKGHERPERASDGFVAMTFDSFAASFESKLAKLGYRAPALTAAMVEDTGLAQDRSLDVLDAGCGTGLCGPLLAPYARTLTGVDLSAGMLKQAEAKAVYSGLHCGELTAFLREHPASFDLIVSADTLCYFGALDTVMAAAADALRPGGHVIFTVERAADDDGREFRLETHGRYTHAQPYVERTLQAAGLTPAMVPADLRMESGVPVAGLVVRERNRARRRRREPEGARGITMSRIIEVVAPDGVPLLFHGMSAREEMSRLFEFDLDLISEDSSIKMDDVLGHNITVKVAQSDDSWRYFNGFVTRFSQGEKVGRHRRYHATVRPWLWFLTRTSDCRIFQEMTVPDILKKVFQDFSSDVEWHLTASYRKWTYCVQYRETDFNFVSRLMEQEGIGYYFKHTEGHNTLVLTDSLTGHEAADYCPKLQYIPSEQYRNQDEETIDVWEFTRELEPTIYVHTDYDFERPSVKLLTKQNEQRSHPQASFEMYDYPGNYIQTGDGQQYAHVRLDEWSTLYDVASGASNSRGITVGALLDLLEHPRDDQNKQ
ncbi:MAG: type VI secretion system tip protein TssI/VgrG [Vicinamibacterales bacterium]